MINVIYKLIIFTFLSLFFISCGGGGGGGGGGTPPAPVNNAPTLSTITNVTTEKGVSKNITLIATDVNGDTLTYSATSTNNTINLSISNNILTINPNSFVGTVTITVTVTDSKNATDSKSFTLTVNPTYTVNGTVVDGYIKGATVCFDANNNGNCDSDESKTTTDESGNYTFENLSSLNPQMNFIAFGGTDTATNTSFESTIKRVINTNETSEIVYITPITDVVATQFLTNKNLDEIETNVSNKLNINKETINSDPTKNDELFKKTQEIETTKKLIRAVVTNHDENELSKEIADEINTNQTISISNILENIDSTVEQDKITFVETQFNTIVEKLKNSNSSTSENIQKEIETQITSVKTKIDNNEYKNPTNNAPTLSTVSNLTTEKGISKNITLNATDVDGDSLTYSVTSTNNTINLSISNNTLTINPNTFVGTATITVTVRDSKNATDSKSFTLTVQDSTPPTPVNNAPTLSTISNTTTPKGVSKNITLIATDVDGDVLTYSATSTNNTINLSISNNTLTINPNTFVGTATITVTVRDSKNATDSKSFTLTVQDSTPPTPINNAPTLSAISNTTTPKGVSKSITLIATDVDGDVLTYSATSTNNTINLSVLNNILTINPNSFVGTATITVTVRDSKNATDSKSFTLTVNQVNTAPTLEVINDVFIQKGTVKNITLNGSDIDGDVLTYSATSSRSDIIATIVGNTLNISTSPTMSSGTKTGTITVTVKDSKNASDSKTFNISAVSYYVEPSINGKVIDGYVKNATVCLDLNINNICDAGEIQTNTNDSGEFKLDYDFKNLPSTNRIINIIASGGINNSTNKSFSSVIKRVVNLDKLLKNDVLNITPISDLIASDFLKNPTNTSSYLAGLETNTIPTKISIDSTKVYADPTLDYTLFIKTQEIESIKKFIRNIYQVDEKALSTAILDVILAKNPTTPLSISAVLTKLNRSVDNTKLTFMEQQFTILREQINSINSNSLLNTTEKIIDKQISFILNKVTNSQFKKINNFITSIDINSSNLLSNIAINEDEILIVDVLNADSLTITSSNPNIVITKDGDMVILTPNENWNGTSTINVGAKSFNLTVNPINDVPAMAELENLILQKNSTQSVTLSGTDVDGDNLTYSAISTRPELTVSIVNNKLSLTSTSAWTGTASIRVTANDGVAPSLEKTFNVEIVSYYVDSFINGKVIDGYIKNAKVCLDLNLNNICDAGEIQTTTNDNGEFKLDYQFKNLSSDNRLINIIASEGVDTFINKSFQSIIKRVINLNNLNQNDVVNVTPISDLVASEFLASSTKNDTKLSQIESNISTNFPIDSSKIYGNPVLDYSLFIKTQEIENIKKFVRNITTIDEKALSKAISGVIIAKNSSTLLTISNILTELNKSVNSDKLAFTEKLLITFRNQLNTINSSSVLNENQQIIDEQISFISNKITNTQLQTINNFLTPVRLNNSVLPSLSSVTINEDEMAIINVQSSNEFTFSSSNNAINIEKDGNILILTPNANWNGSATITVGTKTFNLTVNPVNDAPSANSPNKLTMQRNTTQFTMLSGTDIENDPLTFRAESNTDKVTINITNGNKINLTANSSWTGVATITIFANDGSLNSSGRGFDVEVVSHYDSDNDLIADDIEELIGTDKNIADENTNGILDGIESGTPKSDTYFDKLWHIRNVGQTGVYPAQPNLTATNGNDLGITRVQGKYMGYNGGNPLIVAVVDGTIDFNHEDLVGSKENNLSVDLGEDSGKPHATQVAGILGARAFNGKGVRGVAPYIKIAGINLTDNTDTSAVDFSEKLKTAWLDSDPDGKVAIVNNSWAGINDVNKDVALFYDEYMKIASETKRVVNGEAKGKLFVCAAGNDRWRGGYIDESKSVGIGTEFYGMLNNPYVITVAASNDNNVYSTYSNPGSNIWVTAYGGKDNSSTPVTPISENSKKRAIGVTTTYKSNSKTDDGYRYGTDTNYDAGMSGTSAATPMVSGVLALTLEACPNLNWRDVKHLLAKYATKIDPSNPTWVTNNAGYHHSTDYGFGLVNVEAMINDCTHETTPALPTTIKDIKESKNVVAPSFSTTYEETMNFTSDVTIESIGLSLQINDAKRGQDLQIDLISPSGTKIRMARGKTSVDLQWTESSWVYTGGFFGENAQGIWKIQIKVVAGGTSHILTKVNLRAFGH